MGKARARKKAETARDMPKGKGKRREAQLDKGLGTLGGSRIPRAVLDVRQGRTQVVRMLMVSRLRP